MHFGSSCLPLSLRITELQRVLPSTPSRSQAASTVYKPSKMRPSSTSTSRPQAGSVVLVPSTRCVRHQRVFPFTSCSHVASTVDKPSKMRPSSTSSSRLQTGPVVLLDVTRSSPSRPKAASTVRRPSKMRYVRRRRRPPVPKLVPSSSSRP